MSNILRFECLQPITRHGRHLPAGTIFPVKKSSSRVHVERWIAEGRVRELSDENQTNQHVPMKSLRTATTGIFGKGPKKPEKKAAAAPRKTTATTTAPSVSTRSDAKPNDPAKQGEFKIVPTAKLWRSATNRLVEKDEEYVKMRESVREHGILQPLVVRALPAGEWFIERGSQSGKPGYFVTCRSWNAYVQSIGRPDQVWHPVWSQFAAPFFKTEAEAQAHLPEYEIIIGEHRWTAALEIGLAEVPIMLRVMDDRNAILAQLSENLRRKNLKPLDEARGYQRMMDMGMKVEEIGKELGSGDKELSKSTIYARLKLLQLPPTALEGVEKGIIPASHAELITKLTTPEAQAALTTQILTPKKEWSNAENGMVDVPISFREAKELADRAAKEEEKEQKWQASTKEHRDKGQKVLTLKQSEGVFQYGRLKSGYVFPGDKCDLDPQGRTWKLLLGKHEPTPMVAHDSYATGANKTRVVYARKAAEKALKLAGHESLVDTGGAAKKGESAEDKRKREQAKREEEQRVKKLLAGENITKVVAAAEAREPNADFFRLIIDAICDNEGIDDAIIERRKIPVMEKDGWQKTRLAVKRYAAKADGKTLRGLLLECFLWDWDGAKEDELQAAAKLYKVKLQTSGKKKGGADAEDDNED